MNLDFISKKQGQFSYWSFRPWIESCILHGFVGKSRFSEVSDLSKLRKNFEQAFKVDSLLLMHQVHGNNIIDLRKADRLAEFKKIVSKGRPYPECFQSDAVLLAAGKQQNGICSGYGILTADCLPIIIRSRDEFALVHAGWRGLANNVIENAVQALMEKRARGTIEVVIGPCISGINYEVGPEVIESIGEEAVYEQGRQGRYELSILKTAKAALKSILGRRVKIFSSGICTADDQYFHSYRKEGGGRRNLSFLIA
jgi:copper oxidase (laccase) domain-containing protein